MARLTTASRVVTMPDGRQALDIAYRPTATVKRFLDDTRMITGLFGPLGCGKTVALCQKAYKYAQAFPGARVLIARDTYPNLISTTMTSWFEWFPDGVAGTYYKTERRFVVWTAGKPSEIYFRAMDEQRDIKNVLSLEVAAVGLDEPQGGPNTKGGAEPGINEDLYRSIVGRIGRQKGYPLKMLWLVGNPPSPSHWIAKEFEYGGVGEPRQDHLKRCLYLADQEENRANLHPTYYEDLMELWGTDTPLARRFIFGEWVEFGVEQAFRPDWVRYWGSEDEPLPALSELAIEAGVDPAISKRDTAAKSAIVVAGQQRRGMNRGRIYVLAAVAGHWSVYEAVDQLLKLVVAWKVRTVRVEDVAFQKALGDVLDHEARQRGIVVNVELVKPDADKLRRALAWSPFVENATVLFGPAQRDLVEAMVSVPMDQTRWDLVDAAGIVIRGFPVLQGESQPIPGMEASTPKRAISYAARVGRSSEGQPAALPASVRSILPGMPDSGMKRAAGYAVRIRRMRER